MCHSLRLLAVLLALAALPSWAATVTHKVATADTDATPNVSGAFTPVSGDLLVVGVCVSATTDATGTLSSSIGGFTFTQVRAQAYASNSNYIYLYVADALVSNTSSQTVTWTETADAGSGSAIMVAAVAGMSRDGADAVIQTATHTGGTAITPATVFAGAAMTGNPTLGFVCNSVNPATMTAPTGWTEAADVGYATPDAGAEYVFRNSGFTGTTITWGSVYGGAISGGALSVELDTSASAPTFTVGPSVAAAADGYTISGTITGSGTLTVEAVACAPGDAVPTSTEIEAGQCGGGNAALMNASEVWTTGVSNDFLLTSANKPARLDVYISGTDGTTDTAVTTAADQNRTARTGFALVALASVSTTGVCDLDSYFNPDCAIGDVFEYEDDTNESADCNVSFETDGDVVLTPVAAGNCDGRQTFEISYEDVSSATTGLFTAPSTGNFTTDDTIYVNNSAPVCSAPETVTVLTEDAAMTAINLAIYCTDDDGDALTMTETGATSLPAGTSIVGTSLTGTPTTENEAGVVLTFTATDVAGDADTFDITVYVVNTWTLPNLVGMNLGEAATAILTAAPWRESDVILSVSSFICDVSTATGDIYSQVPAAAAELTAFEALTTVVDRLGTDNMRRTNRNTRHALPDPCN